MFLNSPGPLLTQGRTAEVYAWRENRILKLFYDWVPAEWAQHECDIGRLIAGTTLPTPRMVDSREVGGRQGIIYERVNGPSMLKLISSRPWLVLRMARQFAELHTLIHRQAGKGLIPLRPSLKMSIEQAELPADLRARALGILEKLADYDRLCHFDFHPDQVLMTANGPVIIDWMTALQGDPLADVARTSVLFLVGQVPYGGGAMRALVNLYRGFFYRAYLGRYLELNRGRTRDEIQRWMIPIAAARLQEAIPGEREALIKLIEAPEKL